MRTDVRFTAIFISNMLGLIMLGSVLIGNRLRLKQRDGEILCIAAMMIISGISCIVDGVTILMNGTGGAGTRVFMIFGKTWLFAAYMMIAVLWVVLLHVHLRIWKNNWWKKIVAILPAFGILFLVINLFYPIVFQIDANNEYIRLPLFHYFYVVLILYMMIGFLMHFQSRHRSGLLRFFPIWAFVIPILIGAILQYHHYGISVIWPTIVISISGILIGVKNELIYRDQLTGLYNRYYLDLLQDDLRRRNGHFAMTGIMLDLNGFKGINDDYGHTEGDVALAAVGRILADAGRNQADVIRYAGDEFVMLISSTDGTIVKTFVDRIQDGFDEFNEKSGKPYILSAAIGTARFDPLTMQVDDFINVVDHNMYESKRVYYEDVEHNRRRTSLYEGPGKNG